jgi:hypothetical protein
MSLWDLVLYVAIALALVIGGALYIFFVPPQRWVHLTHTWFAFTFFTVLLAVALAKMYWSARKRAKLWVLLGLFPLAHIAAYVVFLKRVPDWPTFWYIPSYTAEGMLFMVLTKLGLNVMPTTTRL